MTKVSEPGMDTRPFPELVTLAVPSSKVIAVRLFFVEMLTIFCWLLTEISLN